MDLTNRESNGERGDRTDTVSAPDWLQGAIASVEGNAAIDRTFGPLERSAAPVSSGRVASVLRGEWLGHALHPLMTDLPLGCWMSAGVLDLFGGRRSRRSAQRLVGAGLLLVPPTVASGLSDWSTLRDARTRRVGAVHAIGNTVVALAYHRSWRARRRGHHSRGIALGLFGGGLALITGYLGGHLSFARGAGQGPRGLALDAPIDTDAPTDGVELIDLRSASAILGVPEPQLRAMVEEGMLDPVQESPELLFREPDVLAPRLLGA
jgi:uncharacterized membrane protein